MSRRFQFSLRALLVATTIAAISSALLRWHANRIEVLADSFFDLIHQRRYKEAEAVAMQASHLYPDDDIAKHLEVVCFFALLKEYPPKEGTRLDFDITPWQKLVDERRARVRAANARAPSETQE